MPGEPHAITQGALVMDAANPLGFPSPSVIVGCASHDRQLDRKAAPPRLSHRLKRQRDPFFLSVRADKQQAQRLGTCAVSACEGKLFERDAERYDADLFRRATQT